MLPKNSDVYKHIRVQNNYLYAPEYNPLNIRLVGTDNMILKKSIIRIEQGYNSEYIHYRCISLVIQL